MGYATADLGLGPTPPEFLPLIALPDTGSGRRQRHAGAMLSGARGAYDGPRRAYRFVRPVGALA